jgi:hypothetical protein
MSSLVLLNSDGIVARSLQFVTLPEDYVVPPGMTVSWRTAIHVSSGNSLDSFTGPREPVEAYFYFGHAWGQVCRGGFKPYERDNSRIAGMSYGSRVLTVTVQGTSAKDVMALRDHILGLMTSGTQWDVSNDLNPKPKIRPWRRLVDRLRGRAA